MSGIVSKEKPVTPVEKKTEWTSEIFGGWRSKEEWAELDPEKEWNGASLDKVDMFMIHIMTNWPISQKLNNFGKGSQPTQDKDATVYNGIQLFHPFLNHFSSLGNLPATLERAGFHVVDVHVHKRSEDKCSNFIVYARDGIKYDKWGVKPGDKEIIEEYLKRRVGIVNGFYNPPSVRESFIQEGRFFVTLNFRGPIKDSGRVDREFIVADDRLIKH